MKLSVRILRIFSIMKYKIMSDCKNVTGKPKYLQPALLLGKGKIKFNKNVRFGIFPSPGFIGGYQYIEARSSESIIDFGDDVIVNNNCVFISDGPGIYIGKRTMFGWNCEVFDSDFHDIKPENRLSNSSMRKKVVIGDNVMIGSNVKILKGVKIGDNSVISNGTVVAHSIPENTLVYSTPPKGGRLPDLSRWIKK
ncbi:acyltransferase [Marispirochaeta aestuarii]|uniref:acyltransferase n=1 Tax=Marispirochaeta aestuarii TaxID=1963862 RepID=UPI0029C80F46|nr:acyltransferase [Marispirochaeta aestuarii]